MRIDQYYTSMSGKALIYNREIDLGVGNISLI